MEIAEIENKFISNKILETIDQKISELEDSSSEEEKIKRKETQVTL